jgi:hypothetical protein
VVKKFILHVKGLLFGGTYLVINVIHVKNDVAAEKRGRKSLRGNRQEKETKEREIDGMTRNRDQIHKRRRTWVENNSKEA